MADEEEKKGNCPEPPDSRQSLWRPWEVVMGLLLASFSLIIPVLILSVVGLFRFLKLQAAKCALQISRVWRRLRSPR